MVSHYFLKVNTVLTYKNKPLGGHQPQGAISFIKKVKTVKYHRIYFKINFRLTLKYKATDKVHGYQISLTTNFRNCLLIVFKCSRRVDL